MKVNFVDLAAQNAETKAGIDLLIDQIHSTTSYIGGQHVSAFEQAFASFIGVKHVIGVSSGTDALRLALLALGIRPGDSVITTPMTFIATVAAIVQTGARPIFVDIDPGTCNIDPAAVSHFLNSRKQKSIPRAILAVDLYGLPAALQELRGIAEAYDLKLLEDACQAHGASIRIDGDWKMVGGTVPAAAFSFYPGKNLGAWGEAGAVTTDDNEVAEGVMRLRDHGRTSHFTHDLLGYNARLDALQAAVLSVKLLRLPEWNKRRREIAALYRELLADADLELPDEPEGYRSCYHLYVVRSEKRERICTALTKAGIAYGIHYPIPLHLQPGCKFLGYRKGDFPHAEKLADTALSLPMHPHMSDGGVEYVVDTIKQALL